MKSLSVLELEIGQYALVSAQPNKWQHLKDTPCHHVWEWRDVELEGYFREFVRLQGLWVARHGVTLTVGKISEFEDGYIKHCKQLKNKETLCP